LTVRESALDVPTNLEARRRIAFFTNSLFMDMPRAPRVRKMLSFRCDLCFIYIGLEHFSTMFWLVLSEKTSHCKYFPLFIDLPLLIEM
jgi:hypothetical protein